MRKQMRSPRGRYIGREERIKILEALEAADSDQKLVCKQLQLPPRIVGRVVAAERHRKQRPAEIAARAALGIKERTIRERLYEKSVQCVERGLAPPIPLIQEFLASKGIPAPDDILAPYLALVGKQAQNAIKVLEGLPDGLVHQGEMKHSGSVEVQAKVAIILANLAEGRKRVAELRSGTAGD